MRKGPDLSKWQGIVDFGKLKKEADFVILRSSYGIQSKDKMFFEYATGAKNAGIPVLGVYHFCYANSIQQAELEAINAIDAVETAGLSKDTIIFYDLEYDSIDKALSNGVRITNKEVNAFTVAFCHKVQEKGYRAGVYFNKDYYRNKYDKSTLEHYIKWLAEYKGMPSIECDIQQVSSSYSVPGISGIVDWNYLWNDGILKEREDTMSEEEFYQKFEVAMQEYLLRLRMKEPSAWSEAARKFCIENNIFHGDGDGNFMWNDYLTREQAAQLIYNQHKKDTE